MQSYKEECIIRKCVQRGVIELKPSKAKKPRSNEWLLVFLNFGSWRVWNSYKNEEFAFKQLNKMSFWRMYVVHADIFAAHYQHQHL